MFGNERNSESSAFFISTDDSDMKTTQLPGLKCGKGEGWFEDTGFTTYNSSTLNAVLYMGKGNWTEELTTNGSCNKFTTAAQEYFRYERSSDEVRVN